MPDHGTLLQTTSAGVAPDGSTYVVLKWEALAEVAGYNLYRRTAEAPPAPSRPINGDTPIAPPASARALRALIPEGSPEWRALATGFTALLGGSGAVELVDPGASFERGLTADELRLVRAGAQASLAMAHVAGLAYTDRAVVTDEHYLYELRGVLRDGGERTLASDVPVQAGRFVLPDPPSGVSTQAGDRRVLVLWNRNPYASTFTVQRATAPGGPFQQVNPKPVAYDMATDLDDNPLPPTQSGFLDLGAWDADGFPAGHPVAGVTVHGPDNGVAYWYRVASRDALERTGPWSGAVAATPVRGIAPMAPDDLQVAPTTAANGLALTWRKVTRNVENHRLPDTTQANFVYRAETLADLEDLATLPTRLVATLSTNPQDPATALVEWTDFDPILRPPYGTKRFFYRVRVADPFGHGSAPSAAIAGAVPDTTPPGPTELVGASGEPDHIRVEWKPNGEPDLAGYQVYRGVCDRGFIHRPGIRYEKNAQGKIVAHGESRYGCDLTLVGEVPLGEANAMSGVDGRIRFDDFSVPAGSPLCYGYWVRAYDQAGNLYPGDKGCPLPGEYRCARLRERTPPPVPVLTGLRARNKAVLVEWMCAPVQDLRAFHVYRSDAELAPPAFLACVFTDGTVSAAPWTGLLPSCDEVPAVLNPLAARGSYLDATAQPHRVYWYRVSALDWLGNESEGADIARIPASSTFTYTADLPASPMVLSPTLAPSEGCGLAVAWTPAFDPAALQGFVVFRATSGGPFRQVSGILGTNDFTDLSARRGVDYAYVVQSIDHAGILSPPSLPVVHRF